MVKLIAPTNGWNNKQFYVVRPSSRFATPAEQDSWPFGSNFEAGTEKLVKKLFNYIFYFLNGDVRLCVTIVEKDLAITAVHCIPTNKAVGDLLKIFNQSDNAYEAKIVFLNKELDLALLVTAEELEIEPLEIGSYGVGTDYVALGYPLDEDNKRQFIKSPNATKGCNMTRVVQNSCVYGDSGESREFSGGLVFSLDPPVTLIGMALGGRGLPKSWPLNDFLIRALSFCGETPRLKILPAITAVNCMATLNVERKGLKRSATEEIDIVIDP